MKSVHREKRYYCGEYLDVYIYLVFEQSQRRAGKRVKRRPSTEAQQKLRQSRTKKGSKIAWSVI